MQVEDGIIQLDVKRQQPEVFAKAHEIIQPSQV
jgi:hypothetical protein